VKVESFKDFLPPYSVFYLTAVSSANREAVRHNANLMNERPKNVLFGKYI
jgi:hypothetical protein